MDELRISDADRAQALDLLSEQYAQGRLDKDEFDERSDAIWSAKTQGDLAPVFADLPWRSPEVPVRTSGRGRQWGPRWAPPLLPLIVVLVLLTGADQDPVLAAAHRALVRVRVAPPRAPPDAPPTLSAQMSGRRFASRGSCS